MNSLRLKLRSRRLCANRSGFTLTETVVSVATASALMVGLGSTVYLASRATTDEDRPTSKIVGGSLALDSLAAELHYAVSFHERGSRAVEFTIADRTGDGVAETIRYEWSGTSGDPLLRRFNSGALQVVHEDVSDFELGYTVQTIEEVPDEEDSDPVAPTETLAASFDGWSGITPTTTFRLLSAGSWVSEYFELPWPAGATSFRATKLRLKVGQYSTTGQFTVGFYTASGGTGPLPSSTLLGSQHTVSTASLPVTPAWKEFTFSDVTMSDSASGYNIVVKAVTGGGKLGHLQSTAAPQDSTVMKYSTNSGGSWSPIVSQEKYNDANFEVYGIFEGGTTETEVEPIERYFVRAVSVALQAGEATSNRVRTAVDILNAPEVAAP
jgi:hypothetical protein